MTRSDQISLVTNHAVLNPVLLFQHVLSKVHIWSLVNKDEVLPHSQSPGLSGLSSQGS